MVVHRVALLVVLGTANLLIRRAALILVLSLALLIVDRATLVFVAGLAFLLVGRLTVVAAVGSVGRALRVGDGLRRHLRPTIGHGGRLRRAVAILNGRLRRAVAVLSGSGLRRAVTILRLGFGYRARYRPRDEDGRHSPRSLHEEKHHLASRSFFSGGGSANMYFLFGAGRFLLVPSAFFLYIVSGVQSQRSRPVAITR